MAEISNLEFDPQTNMPNRFSAKLRYAEPCYYLAQNTILSNVDLEAYTHSIV